jgi:hypothetical protein
MFEVIDDLGVAPAVASDPAPADSSGKFIAIVSLALLVAVVWAVFLALPDGFIGSHFTGQEKPVPYPTSQPVPITHPVAKSTTHR